MRRPAGSPPHARGRHPTPGVGVVGIGITPACAGKTLARRWRVDAQRDHPRMRGEDVEPVSAILKLLGSPPHARGRLTCPRFRWRRIRITPACAGKTTMKPSVLSVTKDHPRMRGEDPLSIRRQTFQPGSPPHARGRRSGGIKLSHSQRITPACAGKTVVL